MKRRRIGREPLWKSTLAFFSAVYRLSRVQMLKALLLLSSSSVVEGLTIAALLPALKLLIEDKSPNKTIDIAARYPILHGLAFHLNIVDVLILLAVLGVARSILNRAREIATLDAILSFVSRLRVDFFSNITMASWELISSKRASNIQSVLSLEIGRINIATSQALLLMQALLMLSVYLLLTLMISPVLTSIATVVGVILFICLEPVRRRAHKQGTLVTARSQEQIRITADFLGGLKLIKSLNAEKLFRERYRLIVSATQQSYLDFVTFRANGSALFHALIAVGFACYLYIALVVEKTSFADVLVIIVIFTRIAPRFSLVQTTLQEVISNLPAFGALNTLNLECLNHIDGLAGGCELMPPAKSIELKNVSFRHMNSDRLVLEDVSLKLNVGRIHALIGPSGSGKSTIADLLLGLLEPLSGQLLMDSTPLRKESIRWWRNQVGYVPQEGLLLHDTISANLKIGMHAGVGDDELWAALRLANAAAFVEQMPEALQTIVGDRGVRLSGGERQRVVLARALLRKPKILILDEATSALDWESQNAIAGAISSLRGEITVLTIAHRLSMISFADDVTVLAGGKVVESGDFNSLSVRSGGHLANLIFNEGTSRVDYR